MLQKVHRPPSAGDPDLKCSECLVSLKFRKSDTEENVKICHTCSKSLRNNAVRHSMPLPIPKCPSYPISAICIMNLPSSEGSTVTGSLMPKPVVTSPLSFPASPERPRLKNDKLLLIRYLTHSLIFDAFSPGTGTPSGLDKVLVRGP